MENVIVAIVHHKHGENFYVSKTNEGITKQLATYAREWWGDCFDTDAPSDDELAISEYFEYQAEHEEEYYESETVEVIG
jgi:hypothetical protein